MSCSVVLFHFAHMNTHSLYTHSLYTHSLYTLTLHTLTLQPPPVPGSMVEEMSSQGWRCETNHVPTKQATLFQTHTKQTFTSTLNPLLLFLFVPLFPPSIFPSNRQLLHTHTHSKLTHTHTHTVMKSIYLAIQAQLHMQVGMQRFRYHWDCQRDTEVQLTAD